MVRGLLSRIDALLPAWLIILLHQTIIYFLLIHPPFLEDIFFMMVQAKILYCQHTKPEWEHQEIVFPFLKVLFM